jgi:hypothetical protein
VEDIRVKESNGRGWIDQSKEDSQQGHIEKPLGTLTQILITKDSCKIGMVCVGEGVLVGGGRVKED